MYLQKYINSSTVLEAVGSMNTALAFSAAQLKC